MILLTKDLLINLLIIIIMCLIGNIFLGYFVENIKHQKWGQGIIGAITIIVCIIFGNEFQEGYLFDLRQIPYILISLAEGPLVSIGLLATTIVTRSFYGGIGVYAALITYSLATLLTILLRKYYLKGSFSTKLLINLSLSSFCSIIHLLFIDYFSYIPSIKMEFWLFYLTIPSLGIILVFALSDGIKKYFLLKKELFKIEKERVVSHLAASFGHELRNPLTSTRGFLQLLLQENLTSEKKKQYVKTAMDELDHAESIISSYLTFANPHLQKKELLEVRDEIKKVINIAAPMASMNNVNLKFYDHPIKNNWMLEGEQKLFHQCLIYILKNAIEAMPNGGLIKIETDSHGITNRIRISDTGIGMTKEKVERLGEPYFSNNEKGTGLGMMVVYSIVKSMHGKIEVESEVNIGTTVTISLPTYSNPEIKREIKPKANM